MATRANFDDVRKSLDTYHGTRAEVYEAQQKMLDAKRQLTQDVLSAGLYEALDVNVARLRKMMR